jgi:hypothetical protein
MKAAKNLLMCRFECAVRPKGAQWISLRTTTAHLSPAGANPLFLFLFFLLEREKVV